MTGQSLIPKMPAGPKVAPASELLSGIPLRDCLEVLAPDSFFEDQTGAAMTAETFAARFDAARQTIE